MPKQIHGRSRGFTLVEMSIVLVIIGLIIGGILKGQEIIASARQKAVVNQVNAVKAATSTYFDRYRALPGDDPSAHDNVDNSLNNGDGGGYVGTKVNSSANIGDNPLNSAAGENYQFFNGLIAAGLLNGGQVTGATATTIFGQSALPASPISGAGLTLIYGTHNSDGTASVRTSHWLRMHKDVNAPASSMSPRVMQAIDNQMDDGLPLIGGVRDAGSSTACAASASGVGTKYAVSDDVICLPVFEISQ